MLSIWGSTAKPAGRSFSFVSNCPSKQRASAAVSLFFLPNRRCAHSAASSPVLRSVSSAISWSRKAADAPGSRTVVVACGQIFACGRSVKCCDVATSVGWPSPVGRGSSDPEVPFIGAERSGASRSSSPAMPTRVNNAGMPRGYAARRRAAVRPRTAFARWLQSRPSDRSARMSRPHLAKPSQGWVSGNREVVVVFVMALLSLRIRHPEPNGSRRATPPSLIQHRPGHSRTMHSAGRKSAPLPSDAASRSR